MADSAGFNSGEQVLQQFYNPNLLRSHQSPTSFENVMNHYADNNFVGNVRKGRNLQSASSKQIGSQQQAFIFSNKDNQRKARASQRQDLLLIEAQREFTLRNQMMKKMFKESYFNKNYVTSKKNQIKMRK